MVPLLGVFVHIGEGLNTVTSLFDWWGGPFAAFFFFQVPVVGIAVVEEIFSLVHGRKCTLGMSISITRAEKRRTYPLQFDLSAGSTL